MEVAGYALRYLSPQLVTQFGDQIVDVLNDIRGAHFTPKDLLIEEKEGRIFHNKWKHSVALFDSETIVAVLIAYEREPVEHTNYTDASIYINQLAVHREYRAKGVGTNLMTWFLKNEHMQALEDTKKFSVQTNSAAWNESVRRFYESFGFAEIGKKQYPNNLDIVYILEKYSD